jgi:monooxygenase
MSGPASVMPEAAAPNAEAVETLDVLIVGAGISGIGIAHHLQEKHPAKSYAILEARDALGGTWDLFRYPGIRSDSDLHTFGYSFKPWVEDRVIADGSAILDYIAETARERSIDRMIRLGHRVHGADWSSEQQRWTVEVEQTATGQRTHLLARWLFCAGGYYRYEEGFTPALPDIDRYGGQIVHPQFWPEDLDCTGKRVLVIGSGATAVTIVPAIADAVEHVTMLQRTPSYVMSIPAIDPITDFLDRRLGAARTHRIAREKNIRLGGLLYKLCRRYPRAMRKLLRAGAVKALPAGFDVDTHFNPPYDPWDQRLCLVPDGDLFKAIATGKASLLTDRIASFTDTGVLLESGAELEADIVVTATGLQLQAFAGVALSVDGVEVSLPDTFTYKGMMLTGVPNFAYLLGYTNASWTLRVDLIGDHFSRLLSLMDEHHYGQCVPEAPPAGCASRPLLEFDAGYVSRSVDLFPRQGPGAPWELSMDYVRDRKSMRRGPIGDHMRFSAATGSPRSARSVASAPGTRSSSGMA